MKSRAYTEAIYFISHVSQICNIHPQTLRQYEREGFITPKRSDGGVRLYSLEDINKIKNILHLTRDLGINLAGVDYILKMQRKIDELEEKIEYFEKITNSSSSKALVVKKSNYDIIVFED